MNIKTSFLLLLQSVLFFIIFSIIFQPFDSKRLAFAIKYFSTMVVSDPHHKPNVVKGLVSKFIGNI